MFPSSSGGIVVVSLGVETAERALPEFVRAVFGLYSLSFGFTWWSGVRVLDFPPLQKKSLSRCDDFAATPGSISRPRCAFCFVSLVPTQMVSGAPKVFCPRARKRKLRLHVYHLH